MTAERVENKSGASNGGTPILLDTHTPLEATVCAVGATSFLAIVLLMLVTTRDLTRIVYPVLFLICAGLSAVIAWRRYCDLLSPVVLMAVGWVGPVILYSLDLSPLYLVRFRAETWWIVIGTLLLFNAGCFVAVGSQRRRGSFPGPGQRSMESTLADKAQDRWGILVLCAYFIVGLSGWIYRVYSLGGFSGIALLSDEPEFVRWQELPRVIGQMPILLLVLPLLCLVRWESEGFKKRKLLWLLSTVAMGTSILDTARSSIYQIVFIGTLFWTLRRGEIPKKTLAVTAVCCLLLFGLVTWQRARFDSGDSTDSALDNVNTLKFLAMPYIYLTTSLANLQLNFDEGRATFDGGGVRTFMPILSWLQIYKPLQIGNYISDWGNGISLYQADLWIDFGWTGLLLGPFVFGLICGWTYRRWRLRNTRPRAMVYSVVATAVIASGFVNWFNSPVTWFLLILIPSALWLPQTFGRRPVLGREGVQPV